MPGTMYPPQSLQASIVDFCRRAAYLGWQQPSCGCQCMHGISAASAASRMPRPIRFMVGIRDSLDLICEMDIVQTAFVR